MGILSSLIDRSFFLKLPHDRGYFRDGLKNLASVIALQQLGAAADFKDDTYVGGPWYAHAMECVVCPHLVETGVARPTLKG